MIVDLDDAHDENFDLPRLYELKAANPLFKLTVFAIPAKCSDAWLRLLPDWIEVWAHGWKHDTAIEAQHWTYAQTVMMMQAVLFGGRGSKYRFVCGFKAPGWQISDATYQALGDYGWMVADQPYNDHRRPEGLRTHRLGDGDHWHGHVQAYEGNGLEEAFPELLERVKAATEFQFVSEAVTPWQP